MPVYAPISEKREDPLLPALFINRELSWLEFNKRVLCQAEDENIPLFERLKFLAIYFSNLDEFFMVRIGSLGDQAQLDPDRPDSKTGWNAQRQIKESIERVKSFSPLVRKVYHELLLEFDRAGVEFMDFENLSVQDEQLLYNRFEEEIRPLLSPLIIDHNHPFPFLANKEQYLIAQFDTQESNLMIGMIGISHLPTYLIDTTAHSTRVIFTADLVSYFLEHIYEKRKIKKKYKLRVTRNADITVNEAYFDYDMDFKIAMQELVKQRRRLAAVRLQMNRQPDRSLREYLCKKLCVSDERILIEKVPLDFSFGFTLPDALHKLGKNAYYPVVRPSLAVDTSKKSLFKLLSERDLLLAFPFQSIRPFVDLLSQAADDPTVVSIHISLYRLAKHSKIASALIRAAENGKKVICLLELRARFDEQSNINYASLLEEAGCTVLYGLDNFKTHAKLCLITRMHHGKISTITQIGTGNYNEKTAEQYTDLSLITPNEEIGQDARQIFSSLCMGEIPERTSHLWVAPRGFKSNVLELIQHEIECQQKNQDGAITIKVNSINDLDIMQALIRASQAGVTIELFVRGICCLRPGIPGYTDHIHIKSIVGRYLEHSRIFVFGTGARSRIFIGSGDLLNRNTMRRVEVFAEVKAHSIRRQIGLILHALHADTVNGWEMKPDGSYRRCDRSQGALNSHQILHEQFSSIKLQPLLSQKGLLPKFLTKLKKPKKP